MIASELRAKSWNSRSIDNVFAKKKLPFPVVEKTSDYHNLPVSRLFYTAKSEVYQQLPLL
jgi:hypothetical protein